MRHVSMESTLLLFLLVTELPCPEVLFGKDVLENFAKFTGKHMCQSLFFIKVAGAASKFEKFLKTPFFLPRVAASIETVDIAIYQRKSIQSCLRLRSVFRVVIV